MLSVQQRDIHCELFTQCRGNDISTPLVSAWEQMAEANAEATIFHYPAWLSTAWQTGAAPDGQLLVIYKGGRPIGIVPLWQHSPWTLETLAFFSPDFPHLLIDRMEGEAVFSALVDWFCRQTSAVRFSLNPCPSVEYRAAFLRACQEHDLVVRERILPSSVIIPLPDSWEAYLENLGAATRKSIRTAAKRLQRDFPQLEFSLHTSLTPAGAEAIEALIRLYRRHWEHQIGGCFFSPPANAEFFRRMIHWGFTKGFIVLPELRIDGKTIAVSIIFHQPEQSAAIFHLIARDMETLPGYYAPGIFLNMESIRWAISQGVREVNIGPGQSEHKVLLGGREEPRWAFTAARSERAMQVGSAADRALHVLQRAPIHVSYHLRNLIRRSP